MSATVYGPNAEDPNAALGLADVFNAGWSGGAFKGSAVDIAVYCSRAFAIPAEEQRANLTAALSSWLEDVRRLRTSLAEMPDLSAFHPTRPEPEVIVRREIVEREVRVPVPVQAPTAAATPDAQRARFNERWDRVEQGMTKQQVFDLVGRGIQTTAMDAFQTYEWRMRGMQVAAMVAFTDGVVTSKVSPVW